MTDLRRRVARRRERRLPRAVRRLVDRIENLEGHLAQFQKDRAVLRGEWAYHKLRGDEAAVAKVEDVLANQDGIIGELEDGLHKLNDELWLGESWKVDTDEDAKLPYIEKTVSEVEVYEWFSPMEDPGLPPDGEIDRFRWKAGVIKERYGIDIRFAELPSWWFDAEKGLVWRLGEDGGTPIFCARDRFYTLLEGIHQGADQMAGRTVA